MTTTMRVRCVFAAAICFLLGLYCGSTNNRSATTPTSSSFAAKTKDDNSDRDERQPLTTPVQALEDFATKLARTPKHKTGIYVKHMRKAGGTAVRKFFYENMFPKKDVTKNCDDKYCESKAHGCVYYEQEYGALSKECALGEEEDTTNTAPWNETLTIAILREPISRQWSEYWYENVNGPSDRLKQQDRVFIQASFLHWVMRQGEVVVLRTEEPTDTPQTTFDLHWQDQLSGIYCGSYYSNFLTRQLTGSCPNKRNHQMQNLDPHHRAFCSQGEEFYGGCRLDETPRHPDAQRIRKAKEILSRFDVVLTTETMDKSFDRLLKIAQNSIPGFEQYNKFGNRDNNSTEDQNQDHQHHYARTRARFLQAAAAATEQQYQANVGSHPRMSDILDEEAMEILRRDNAADLEVYEYARRLAQTFVDE